MSEPLHSARRGQLRVAARLAYVVVILIATWAGLRFDPDLASARQRLARGLWPGLRLIDVVDGVRNVALFAGFGAVWLATADPVRLRRAVWRATLVGTAISLLVETLQLFSPTRMASVLDVLTNGSGTLLGAVVVAASIAIVSERRVRTARAVVPHLLVAGPYLAACALEAFSGWGRADRVDGAWGGPRTRWAAALAELRQHPYAMPAFSDLLLFAPAGFLAVRVLVERGMRPARAAVVASALASLVWALSEAMRGLSGADLRPWAVAWHVAATVLGAALAASLAARETAVSRGRAEPARWERPLLALRRDARAYVALVAVWSLRPFTPVDGLRAMMDGLSLDAFVPLRALASLFNLHSVADVAIGFLLYVPIGAWFAVRPRADGLPGARRPWLGLALAALTEVAQLAVAGRYFDVTDALVQCGGVLVGWAIVRRADVRRARMTAPRAAAALHQDGARQERRPRRAQSAVG